MHAARKCLANVYVFDMPTLQDTFRYHGEADEMHDNTAYKLGMPCNSYQNVYID